MSNKKNLTVKEAFALAVQNHQNNNLQDAQNYYQEVLELDPNHLQTLINLGIIFKELEELEKAKDCYEKAIEIDPLNKKYMVAYGYVLLILNDKLKGYEYIDKVEGVIKFTPMYYKII